MGGSRCSYRSCTVRSDGGKTHMFHYPVFDKYRCRQWLVNAQKLEFLDLSVSQLKNRVICQHHFTDDSFMNCMKNKLKFDAIPTLSGPNCESNDDNQDVKEMIENHILIDDIDDVRLSLHEKQASNVLKYVDFLTCTDTDTLPVSKLTRKMPPIEKSQDLASTLLKDNSYFMGSKDHFTPPKKQSKPKLEMEIDPIFSKQPVPRNTRSNSKVTILSETKLTTTPMVSASEMIPVSPSTVLTAPKQKSVSFETVSVQEINAPWINEHRNLQPFEIIINNNIQNINDMPIVFIDENNPNILPQQQENKPEMYTLSTNVEVKPKIASSLKPPEYCIKPSNQSSPGSKSKMPPERIAAIEEKRNFNKKLRDMIEFCLDELDDPEKAANATKKLKPPLHVKTEKLLQTENRSILINSDAAKSKSNVAQISMHREEPQILQNNLDIPANTLASLEARMSKMEQLLAKKIEHNTQKISELTEYVKSPETMFCQTPTEHEEVYKKRLFKEISKFLSPDANSMVYEELFINKYGKNTPSTQEPPKQEQSAKPAKRQKRR